MGASTVHKVALVTTNSEGVAEVSWDVPVDLDTGDLIVNANVQAGAALPMYAVVIDSVTSTRARVRVTKYSPVSILNLIVLGSPIAAPAGVPVHIAVHRWEE